MWKTFLNKISINYLDKIADESEYIDRFINVFNVDILTKENFINSWSLEGSGLFFEEDALQKMLNSGNLVLTVSFFKYFNDINQRVWVKEEIYNMFNDSKDEFLFKKIIFEPNLLLSKDERNRTLTFLFLYFYPKLSKDGLLFHPRTKTPLIIFGEITFDNFLLLLELMKIYSVEEFNILSKEKNLCHMLIKYYFENIIEIYNKEIEGAWESCLPKDKVYVFLKEGLKVSNFSYYLKPGETEKFKGLDDVLIKIEKQFYLEELKLKIEIKIENSIKNKVKI